MKKMIYVLITVTLCLILVNIVSASSTEVGYEFLDSGAVVRIWNAYGEYYFNATSGIQFSNYYNNYFTKNEFCGGYKTIVSENETWNYDCTDTLDFNWDIESDNLTYVNITGYRFKDVKGKEVRLGIRYWLEQHSKYLGVTVNVKNTGESDIIKDLGFAWKMENISINSPYDDNILIDDITYDLSEQQDMTLTNLVSSDIRLFDPEYYIRLKWNNSLNYKLQVKSEDNQINAPVTLGINAGSLVVGQEKQTTFFWRDPTTSYPILFEGFESGWEASADQDCDSTPDCNSIGGFNGCTIVADGEWCASIDSSPDMSHSGSYGLITQGWDDGTETNTGGIYYTFDATTACDGSECDYITVDIWWWEAGMDTAAQNEHCWVTEQYDGGTPSAILTISEPEDSYVNVKANLTTLDSSTTVVRLMCDMNLVSDDVYWDDFNITGFIVTTDQNTPIFSAYWDDNASVVNTGTGYFNVTIISTNGTVYLEINNTNITATNLTLNNYNASYTFTKGGTYAYKWHSWGNGTEENYNFSTERNYVVNITPGILNVSIQAPDDDSDWYQNEINLTINATVICIGGDCGTVYANVLYNKTTSSPDTLVNITTDADPFYITGGEGWDLSTAEYEYNISSQGQTIMDIWFKPDGTRLYEIGYDDNYMYQYDCSDAWNLSSCEYNDVNIATVDSYSRAMFFKPDGLKMYTLSSGTELVRRFDCTQAWDLDTCSNEFLTFSVVNEDTDANGMFFKPDGSKMYITGYQTDNIYEYDCSTAWLLSSCSYDYVYIPAESRPMGLFFKPDGLKLFQTSHVENWMYQFSCTEAWDLSTCSYDWINASTRGASTGIYISPDGTKLYDTNYASGDSINQYNLELGDGINQKSTTLSEDESWNVNWTLEVTTADIESYLLGVKFNSSNGDISDNSTVNRRVNLNDAGGEANISFNITYPLTGCSENDGCETEGCTECTYCSINAITGNTKYINCTGQNATTPFFTFENTGNTNLNITWKLNMSIDPTLTLFYDTDNDPSGSIEVLNYNIICYQESANVSTACGGLNTGNYSVVGDWTSPENVTDGNWNTLGHGGSSGINNFIYINYTKPSYALNSSLWQVKDEQGFVNLTINSSCWEYSLTNLQLSVQSYKGYLAQSGFFFDCNNGTDWVEMRKSDGYASKVYEESMWWNITDRPIIIIDNLAVSSTEQIWLWGNTTNAIYGNYTYNLTSNSSES